MTFRVVDIIAVASAERQRVGKRGFFHAWNAAHVILQRAKERLAVARLLACAGIERDFRSYGTVGTKAGVEAGEIVEAMQHQPGDSDDHDGETYLPHDKNHRHAKARALTGDASAAHAQSFQQTWRGHAQGRYEAEDKACKKGGREREENVRRMPGESFHARCS